MEPEGVIMESAIDACYAAFFTTHGYVTVNTTVYYNPTPN